MECFWIRACYILYSYSITMEANTMDPDHTAPIRKLSDLGQYCLQIKAILKQMSEQSE